MSELKKEPTTPKVNSDQSFYFIIVTVLFALILDLEGLHSWVDTLSVNFFTLNLSRATDVLVDFSKATGLAKIRSAIKAPWESLKQPLMNPVSQAVSGMSPGLNLEYNPPSLPKIPLVAMPSDPGPRPVYELREPANLSPKILRRTIRIYAAGDSMLGSALQFKLKSLFSSSPEIQTLSMQIKPGTGLTKPKLFDWDYVVQRDLSNSPYDVALIFLGTNDMQNIKDDKHVYNFSTPKWDNIYKARIKNLINATCHKVPHLVWVGPLRMKKEDLDEKMVHISNIIEGALKETNCGHYVNATKWVSHKDGFESFLTLTNGVGKKITLKVRNSDGIHLTDDGARIFSDRLMEFLHTEKYL